MYDDYIDWDKEDAVEITLYYQGDPSDDDYSYVPLCPRCVVEWIDCWLAVGVTNAPYRCVDCERPNVAALEYEAKRKKKEVEES